MNNLYASQAAWLPGLDVRLYFASITKARTAAAALATILVIGLALRIFVVCTQTYVIFEDETFQYLEQAHRLAFG